MNEKFSKIDKEKDYNNSKYGDIIDEKFSKIDEDKNYNFSKYGDIIGEKNDTMDFSIEEVNQLKQNPQLVKAFKPLLKLALSIGGVFALGVVSSILEIQNITKAVLIPLESVFVLTCGKEFIKNISDYCIYKKMENNKNKNKSL